MKRVATIWLAVVLLLGTVLPKSMLFAAREEEVGEYAFDKSRTAVKQLDDIFTTIDLMDATIGDLTREMEAGNATSRQITQMYIDRINAYDGKLKLNSIIRINPYALEEAEKLDKERAEGRIRGPLHGIPILIKDNIDLSGNPTSAGSIALSHMFVSEDAFVVQKLRDAGAVIVAKANLSEFASSALDSSSLLGGTVRNAYDTTRVPAGSSGGTGVAVTSNFAAAGLGTDTGGSIRNPSSYSNLYGIRPSKGLTSVTGVIPLAVPRDTVGPMARTAEDMAQVLEVMAGTDPEDDFTQEAGADDLVASGYMDSLTKDGLKGKRIGYLESSFSFDRSSYEEKDEQEDGATKEKIKEKLTEEKKQETEPVSNEGTKEESEEEETSNIDVPDDKIDDMIKKTRANLAKAGASFVDLSSKLPDSEIYSDECDLSIGATDDTIEYDFNKYLYQKGDAAPYKTLKDLYTTGKMGIDYTNLSFSSAQVQEKMADSFDETVNPYDTEINGYMRGKTWKNTLEGRKKIMKVMEENDIDAIMYVASLDVVPTIANMNKEFKRNMMGWVYGYIFGPSLGMPEMSIPMGFSDTDEKVSKELPLGMRMIGKFGDEKTLMEIAYAYEQQAGESIRRMPENSPALADKNLVAYLDALIEEVYSIDYDLYNKKPEGKVKLMEQAVRKASATDSSDPYATYNAAKKLAQNFDKVMKALEDSGRKEEEKKNQGADQNQQPDQPKTEVISVKSVELSAVSKKIAAGKSVQLTAKVLPENASNRKLKWKSSNTGVATVDQKGLVKIRSKTGGKTVKITASATDGSASSAVWNIKVMKGVVKSITIKGAKPVKAGKKLKLSAVVKASAGANKSLKWKSDHEAWAAVTSKGVVKTRAAGKGKKIRITVMATDGSGKKKTVNIRIH